MMVLMMVDKVDKLIVELNKISKKLDIFSNIEKSYDWSKVPDTKDLVKEISQVVKETTKKLSRKDFVVTVVGFEVYMEGFFPYVLKEEYKEYERELRRRHWDIYYEVKPGYKIGKVWVKYKEPVFLR
jgi:hypothetical protein